MLSGAVLLIYTFDIITIVHKEPSKTKKSKKLRTTCTKRRLLSDASIVLQRAIYDRYQYTLIHFQRATAEGGGSCPAS